MVTVFFPALTMSFSFSLYRVGKKDLAQISIEEALSYPTGFDTHFKRFSLAQLIRFIVMQNPISCHITSSSSSSKLQPNLTWTISTYPCFLWMDVFPKEKGVSQNGPIPFTIIPLLPSPKGPLT